MSQKLEWFDVYYKCPFYSKEITDNDIFGHDSTVSYCKKNGKKTEIPHVICKNCTMINKTKEIINICEEKNIDVTLYTSEKAYSFIKDKCNNCKRQLNCTGEESEKCNALVDYLVAKYQNNIPKTEL